MELRCSLRNYIGAWSELEDGDVGATITPAEASTKLGELIASLDRGPTTPEHNSARSLLRRVVTVVVRRSCTVPTATPVSEDEDEDEDDELDEEGDGEEHEYEGPEEEPGSSGDEHKKLKWQRQRRWGNLKVGSRPELARAERQRLGVFG